jgi:hypothetical protein
MKPSGDTPGSAMSDELNFAVDGHLAALDESGTWWSVMDVRGSTVPITDGQDPAAFGDITIVEDPTDPTGWVAAR